MASDCEQQCPSKKTKKSKSTQNHCRIIVYIIFIIILTVFLAFILICFLRNVPLADPEKPSIPRRHPVRKPEKVFMVHPIHAKSREIFSKYKKKNLTKLAEVLESSEPAALYDYDLNAHLSDQIINFECFESFKVMMASHKIDPNQHVLLHKIVQKMAESPAVLQEQFLHLLIQNGSDLNYIDSEGMTPMAHAINHKNRTALSFLLSRGAIVNMAFPKSDSILHYIFEAFPRKTTSVEFPVDMLVTLIRNGANVFHRGRDGCTPFHRAIFLHCTIEVMNALLNTVPQGFDPIKYKSTLLNYPTSPFAVEQPSSTSFYGFTPLHLAVNMLDSDLAQYLVTQGADLSITDNGGSTAYDYAVLLRNLKLKEILKPD